MDAMKKNNNIIIVGNNSFASLLYEYVIEQSKYNIVAFAVNQEFIKEPLLHNKPVIPLENIENHYNPKDVKLLLGVGYSKMNTIREKLYNECIYKGYEFENFIHETAIIPSDINIGKGNIIFENVTIQKRTKIGNMNVMWPGTNISHDNIIGNFNWIAPSAVIAGKSMISNNCFLGINSSIINNISIGNRVLIGAGAVVTSNVEDEKVVLPAKSIELSGKTSKDFVIQ